MKATELLKQQHKQVLTLFDKIEKAPRKDSKRKLFEELAANLVGHDAIEREIFYPECENAIGLEDILGESLVEHGVVEFCLYQADRALGSEEFEFKVSVLKEMLEHHIEEEQDELFPKIEKALGKEKLEELGTRMEERFEEALQEDFRVPLRDNLSQVLEGTMKPQKRSAPTKRKASGKMRRVA